MSNSTAKFLLLFFLLTAAPSLAYVDPGTAGLLFQMGYIVITSIIAGLAWFFRPIKAFFLRLIGKAKPPEASQETEDDEPENQDS
jgi:TRAP-type C4-dicarboxylate transport system permease small subunit